MNRQVDKNNYDVASISQPGKSRRANHIQNALYIEKERIQTESFVKVLSNIFLSRKAGNKAYI